MLKEKSSQTSQSRRRRRRCLPHRIARDPKILLFTFRSYILHFTSFPQIQWMSLFDVEQKKKILSKTISECQTSVHTLFSSLCVCSARSPYVRVRKHKHTTTSCSLYVYRINLTAFNLSLNLWFVCLFHIKYFRVLQATP